MKIYVSNYDLRLHPHWVSIFKDLDIELSETDIVGSDGAISTRLFDIKTLSDNKVGCWEYHDKLDMTKVDRMYSVATIYPLCEEDIRDFMLEHGSVFVKPRLSNAGGSGSEDPLGYRTFNKIDELLSEIDEVFNFWEQQKDNGGNWQNRQYVIQEALLDPVYWYVKGVYNGVDEPQILLMQIKDVTSQEDTWLYDRQSRQKYSPTKLIISDDQKQSITKLTERFLDRIGGRGFFQLQGKFKGSVPKLIDYTSSYPMTIGTFNDSDGLDEDRADRLLFNYGFGDGTLESLGVIDTDINAYLYRNFDLGTDDYDTVLRRVKFLEDNGNIVVHFDQHIKENVSQYIGVLYVAKTKEELDLKISNLSTQVLSI
jgi:hypothetical protein